MVIYSSRGFTSAFIIIKILFKNYLTNIKKYDIIKHKLKSGKIKLCMNYCIIIHSKGGVYYET